MGHIRTGPFLDLHSRCEEFRSASAPALNAVVVHPSSNLRDRRKTLALPLQLQPSNWFNECSWGQAPILETQLRTPSHHPLHVGSAVQHPMLASELYDSLNVPD